MLNANRPIGVTISAGLMIAGAGFMAWLGTMAPAFFVTIPALLLVAGLLLVSRLGGASRGLMLINQVSGLVMILAIAWNKIMMPIGDMSLTISGIALILVMVTGGPAMSLVAPAALKFSKA